MIDNRITKARLGNHFHYCWWKYLLAAAVSVLGVSLLFDMTQYRPPAEKSTDFYVVSGYVQQEALEQDLWPVLKARCPEQEALNIVNINLTAEDAYSRMQYATYLGAGQGNLLLMSRREYAHMLESSDAPDVFADLTPYIGAGFLSVEGLELSAYRATDDQGREGLYAVPADGLAGLEAFSCDPKNTVFTVLQNRKNMDTAAILIGLMQERYKR